MMSSISTRDGPGLGAARLDNNPIQTEENAKMTSKKLFKKKTFKDEVDEAQETTLQPLEEEATPPAKESSNAGRNKSKKADTAATNDNTDVDDENETVRLSCDLPRRYHTSLRVAAAFSERSILGIIETLIVKHLMDKPTDQIITEYHKSADFKGTDTK
jgi:hypothetical protein